LTNLSIIPENWTATKKINPIFDNVNSIILIIKYFYDFMIFLMEYERVIGLLKREYAESKVLIESEDPFRVLISTILSQRTKDANTAKASKQLFSKYKTPQEIVSAPEKEIHALVKPAGFYRVKTRRIKQVSEKILKDFSGTVPSNMEDLMNLPGVGHKTAACVMVYGFQKPEIPVDVHVAKISYRLGWTGEKNPEKVRNDLIKKIPKKLWLDLNRLFVKHGQKTCLTRKPRCSKCVIKEYCDYS